MQSVIALLTPTNIALFFGVLFAMSEALGAIPSIKANGVFQLIFGILKTLAGK